MPKHIDKLIEARWVVPVEPHGLVLDEHSIAIHHGKIVGLLPHEKARRLYKADKVLTLPHHALVPGLVNAHTHAAMSLLRGIADDIPLQAWLNQHIWPVEHRWVSSEFVADGTELAIAEMIRGGTTCFNDMYFLPNAAATVAARLGMRVMLGLIVDDSPSAWAENGQECLKKGLAVRDEFKGDPLISFALATHAPDSVTTELLRQIRVYADELDLPVHMHVLESAAEVQRAQALWQRSPLEYLDDEGLLGPGLMAAHMTQVKPADTKRLAEVGVNIVHCPESNLKLANGFCPVADLMGAGINVALGTDGAASNNDLDMWGEMKTAALLAKGVAGRADAVSAADVLRMATLNGAQTLGLDDSIGSLEVGKAADLVALDMSGIDVQPVYDVISQLIYTNSRDRVSDVWIAGEQKLRNGQLVDLDTEVICEKTIQWGSKIAGELPH